MTRPVWTAVHEAALERARTPQPTVDEPAREYKWRRSAKAMMPGRRCVNCGVSIVHRHGNATTCSKSCRDVWYSRLYRQDHPWFGRIRTPEERAYYAERRMKVAAMWDDLKTASQIAREVGMTARAVLGLVRRLRRDGLVKRGRRRGWEKCAARLVEINTRRREGTFPSVTELQSTVARMWNDGMTGTQIGAATGQSATAVYKMVRELRARGLVIRDRRPGNHPRRQEAA